MMVNLLFAVFGGGGRPRLAVQLLAVGDVFGIVGACFLALVARRVEDRLATRTRARRTSPSA
ncbi:hypothetical protein SVIOM342S_04398 [Streptomyces violaceorubidus]